MDNDCIFCAIGKGEATADFVYADDAVFVIRDISPKAPTHLLLIPFQHMTFLGSIAPASEGILGHMFTVAAEVTRREGTTRRGYRLVVNQGPDSGQELPHLHMHLLAGRRLRAMG